MLKRPSNLGHIQMSELVVELLSLAPRAHSLHLSVTGEGSFAAHKALNEFYDALPGLVDTVAEGWQGYNEKLLDTVDPKVPVLKTTKDMLAVLRKMHSKITEIQSGLPSDASEIVNDLDNIKSEINSLKYKLLFLQ